MKSESDQPSPADYRRVAEAIHYLEANFTRQPSLDDIAAHVGLSKYHFQRTFKRWAGVTPKRFLQYLTVEHAKDLLRHAATVLDTTYVTGLSGPGRLHDLFVSVEAVTPGEYKSFGAGLEISYGFHDTPFGECLLAVTERGICALAFLPDVGRNEAVSDLQGQWRHAALEHAPAATAPLVEKIFTPGSASDARARLPLYLKGTNFQLQVWKALLRVPEGALASYGDIARLIGRSNGQRAVASAVGRNPVAYLIPCHRVVRSTGTIGGYRYGTERKCAMLGWEAARVELGG